jgi:hypothetical protein
MTEYPTQSCWKAQSATATLTTEALEGQKALFLATHTPVEGFELSGPNAADILEATELGLLDAISAPQRQHAFCVVEGEPGSGKSHLIRWLYVNWQNQNDITILLQRADGSLEGALRELQERLPQDYSYLFDNIGQRQQATLKGRSAMFLATMAQALKPDHFEKPLEDTEWCKQYNPSGLLQNGAIIDGWKAPTRIINILSGSEGERNSASARFNLLDISELIQFEREVKRPLAAVNFLRRLKREAKIIESYRTEKTDAYSLAEDIGPEVPLSMSFVDALNLRRNYSVQNVLGISGQGLKALFRELRKDLRMRKQRLVLLLEDITSWEGIDDSLIDVLVTNAATRIEDSEEKSDADLCDLVSVVGVTPEFYGNLRANYRQRITHEIHLGRRLHQFQDVATIRDKNAQVRFISRYLTATRAGDDRLNDWLEERNNGRHLPVPNICNDCEVRIGCHEAFGEIDGIGLYPFTKGAIINLFDGLKESDGSQTWKTPRGIIQAILSPTLTHPEKLDEGLYPNVEIETDVLTEESRILSNPAVTRIRANVQGDNELEHRLRRLLAYWGDNSLATTKTSTNDLKFDDIHRGVFEAFRLPWIGDKDSDRSDEDETGAGTDSPDGDQSTSDGSDDGENESRNRRVRAKGGENKTSERSKASAAALRKIQAQIGAWRDKGKLQDPDAFNSLLFEIVEAISPRSCCVDQWTWEKFITKDLVRLKGSGRTTDAHFVLDKEDWFVSGLEAYAALKDTSLLETQEEELYRRQYAHMVRLLTVRLKSHFDERLPKLDNFDRWDFGFTVVQMLLSRSWLRGTTAPSKSSMEQWHALLSDENDSDSDISYRTKAWQDALNATNNAHDKYRQLLRKMIWLRQGGAEFGLLDAGTAARAIIQLQETFNFGPFPKTDLPDRRRQSEFPLLQNIMRKLDKGLVEILSEERERLSSRGKEIDELRRGRSVKAHIGRVDSVIDDVSNLLGQAVPDRISEWKRSIEALNGGEDASMAKVQEFLQEIRNGEPSSNQHATLFEWALNAPARDVEILVGIFRIGERTIGQLESYAATFLASDVATGDLKSIHKAGTRLRKASSEAITSLNGAS